MAQLTRRGWFGGVVASLVALWSRPIAAAPVFPPAPKGSVDVSDWTDETIRFTVGRDFLKPEHGDLLLSIMRNYPHKRDRQFERIVVLPWR